MVYLGLQAAERAQLDDNGAISLSEATPLEVNAVPGDLEVAAKKSPQVRTVQVDPEIVTRQSRRGRGTLFRLFRLFRGSRWRVWKMESTHGALNWSGSID
jgi:hypothetical protein